jgi:hypothetical protein
MAKWRRAAGPFLLEEPRDVDVSWSWRVTREGYGSRIVRVDVAPGWLHSTELSAESRRAVKTEGASAVDAFLDEEEPPPLIVVSALGVQARDLY